MDDLKTILVVDDEPGLRTLLRISIGTERFTILDAADGASALAQALEHRPDLVILDVGLPGANGFDVCRTLREHPQTRHTRIVILTAWARDDERQLGIAAGADAYVTKPFRPSELVTLIDRLLDDEPVADILAAAAAAELRSRPPTALA